MELTTLKSKAYLHHLGLESHDPRRLANFYSQVLNMELQFSENKRWYCIGPDRIIEFFGGDSRKLRFASFACENQDSLNFIMDRALREGVKTHTFKSEFFKIGSFSVFDYDNNQVSFGIPKKQHMPKKKFMHGPLQHLTFKSRDVNKFIDFYQDKLGFAVSDRVVNIDGEVTTCFVRSNQEHHNLACFKSEMAGIDHHSYEVGEWNLIRDWCDHFSDLGVKLFWGPGRHGPGNNLFVFIEDCDGNRIELSAELEIITARKIVEWPHEPRTLNLWGEGLMRS